jgi:hypothetical protein
MRSRCLTRVTSSATINSIPLSQRKIPSFASARVIRASCACIGRFRMIGVSVSQPFHLTAPNTICHCARFGTAMDIYLSYVSPCRPLRPYPRYRNYPAYPRLPSPLYLPPHPPCGSRSDHHDTSPPLGHCESHSFLLRLTSLF